MSDNDNEFDNDDNDSNDSHQVWNGANHPLKTMNSAKKGFDGAQATNDCKSFLTDYLARRTCQAPKGQGRRKRSCQCLSFMVDDPDDDALEEVEATAGYMVHWAGMVGSSKSVVLAEKRQTAFALAATGADSNKLCFILPQLRFEESLKAPRMICLNALSGILNVGRCKWETVKKDGQFRHGLIDRKGPNSNKGKGSIDWQSSLNEFFEELKKETTPFATQHTQQVLSEIEEWRDNANTYLHN
jgi:hypothetical protein